MKTVEIVSIDKILDLRHRILRPGLPLSMSQYDFDKDESTIHLGAKVDESVLSCATLTPQQCSRFPLAQTPYQLRGMATAPESRGQSLGSAILKKAEDVLISKNCDLLWLNAREVAFEFYKKNGFEFIGDIYEMPHTGPHKLMFKWLR